MSSLANSVTKEKYQALREGIEDVYIPYYTVSTDISC